MAFVANSVGYPAYTSSSASRYTPVLYAKKLLIKFYNKTVLGEIAQRDYEGQISGMGDKVYIRTRPDIAVSTYTKNMDLNAARQFVEPSAVELSIDYAKFYSVGLDAIDEKQFDIDALDQWSTDASESLGVAIDSHVINAMYASVSAYNTGATAGRISGGYALGTSGAAVSLNKTNILDYISYASSVLSEQNIPKDGQRWMIMPEIFLSRINTSDLRAALFTGDSSNQNLRNGRIGEIAGFKIYGSNSVVAATGSTYPIIFGHKCALTFASQLVKNRTIELQNTFGRALEGLHVYGFSVVKPEAMGVIYATAS